VEPRYIWGLKQTFLKSNLGILIVEDDPLMALSIEELVDGLGYDEVTIVDNSEDAIKQIKDTVPDLIIMDINIKGKLNGIELADKIEHYRIPIIFTTSHNEKEIFESAKKTMPIAYLVKPFNDFTLQHTIEFAVRSLIEEKIEVNNGWSEDLVLNDSLFTKSGNVLYRIKIPDILWVFSDGNYCNIITAKKKHAVKLSLSKLANILGDFNFVRVHQRSMIPLDRISNIDLNANVVHVENEAIAIGPSYRKDLLNRLKRI